MFSSIFHTTPEVKSLVGGLLLICVADGMPEDVDPASTLYWTLVVCLLPTFLQHCSSQFQEHVVMPPSEPIRCQCCSAAQQNMLEWGIDGPTEFAGLLCTKPLEVFRAQKGVVCCPNEETEPSLWQLLELCSADCSARDTLQSWPLPLYYRPHSELLLLNPGDLCNNKVLPLLPACLGS